MKKQNKKKKEKEFMCFGRNNSQLSTFAGMTRSWQSTDGKDPLTEQL